MRGCAGIDVQTVSVSLSAGFRLFVCLLSEAPHFFKFPYTICVKGYLRGRHQIKISCTLKIGTMRARLEVRHTSTYV